MTKDAKEWLWIVLVLGGLLAVVVNLPRGHSTNTIDDWKSDQTNNGLYHD